LLVPAYAYTGWHLLFLTCNEKEKKDAAALLTISVTSVYDSPIYTRI
jgi:hypothetical protein